MSKFNIGDRVQVIGEPTDWDLGTVTACMSSFGEDYCNVEWDSSGSAGCDEDGLYLVCAVADRLAIDSPKRAAPLPAPARYRLKAATLSPHEAVNLASKLLQFATQEGTK